MLQLHDERRYGVESGFKSTSDPVREVEKRTLGYETAERFIPFDHPFLQSGYTHSLSADGKLLAIPDECNIDLYDLDTGSKTILEGHTTKVVALGFSPTDPNLLVSSGAPEWRPNKKKQNYNDIIMWDVAQAKDRGQERERDSVDIDQVARMGVRGIVHGLGDHLTLAGDEKGEIHTILTFMIKRFVARARVSEFARLDGRLKASSGSELFSNAGEYLVYLPGAKPSSDDNEQVWDIGLYHLVDRTTTILSGHRQSFMWIGFSPDDSLVASASRDGTLRVHKTTGEELWTWHIDKEWTAVFSPNGEYLAGTNEVGLIKIWILSNGEEIASCKEGREWCRSIDWSLDGKHLAVGAEPWAKVTLYRFMEGEITLIHERRLVIDKSQEPLNKFPMTNSHMVQFLPIASSPMKLVHPTTIDVGIEVFDFESGKGWRFVSPDDDKEAETMIPANGQVAIIGHVWRKDRGEIGVIAPDGVRFWHLE